MLDSVLIGERLHMMKSGSGPAMLWDVLREGKVTDMSMSPTLLRELMEYYDETICALTPDERDRYVNGVRNLQTVLSSGSALSPSTLRFFTDIANVPIRNGYGLTEMGGGVTTAPVGSAPEEVSYLVRISLHVSYRSLHRAISVRFYRRCLSNSPKVTMENFWPKARICSPSKNTSILIYCWLCDAPCLQLAPAILAMKQPHKLHLTTKGFTKQETGFIALVISTILMAEPHLTVCFLSISLALVSVPQLKDAMRRGSVS